MGCGFDCDKTQSSSTPPASTAHVHYCCARCNAKKQERRHRRRMIWEVIDNGERELERRTSTQNSQQGRWAAILPSQHGCQRQKGMYRHRPQVVLSRHLRREVKNSSSLRTGAAAAAVVAISSHKPRRVSDNTNKRCSCPLVLIGRVMWNNVVSSMIL